MYGPKETTTKPIRKIIAIVISELSNSDPIPNALKPNITSPINGIRDWANILVNAWDFVSLSPNCVTTLMSKAFLPGVAPDTELWK